MDVIQDYFVLLLNHYFSIFISDEQSTLTKILSKKYTLKEPTIMSIYIETQY